jgi:hypothetical protein
VSDAESLETLEEALAGNQDALVICDIKAILSDLGRICSFVHGNHSKVIGYYSHVDSKTREDAAAKGVDSVVPKSALELKLRNLLSPQGFQ